MVEDWKRYGADMLRLWAASADYHADVRCGENIFKRFYRVDQARNDGQSYGLGLSIADSIIREHNGKIWAESADEYNTFIVSLQVY